MQGLPPEKKPAIIKTKVFFSGKIKESLPLLLKGGYILLNPSERLKPPICPFCRQLIEPPVELDGLWFEFDGGVCPCGAHYALDPTARNGGAVLLQAVVQACGGDWDRAITLTPGAFDFP